MKAVILARVSTREQENGMSIDAQLENIRRYCTKREFDVLKEYTLTESSTRGDRVKFKGMLQFVKSKSEKIAIVADCVDRVQRSYVESVELDELRKKDKIEIHFIREGLTLRKDSPSSELMAWDLNVFVAKTYVSSLRDNVKRSMHHNMTHGVWQHAAPIGYKNLRDENDKSVIIPDPDRADLVRKVFEKYATGLLTLGELAKYAEQIGLNGRRSVKSMSTTTIQSMLCNPFYYGEFLFEGRMVEHIYQPLISRDLFDKCQDVMHGKGRKRFKRAEKPHVFRGLMKCADCGCAISSDTKVKKSGKTYTYLACSHYKGNCNQKAVNENVILAQLSDEVFKPLSMGDELLQCITAYVKKSLKCDNADIIVQKNTLTTQINKNADKKSKLTDLLIDDKISQEAYSEKMSEIDAEQAKLKSMLAACTESGKTAEITTDYILDIAARASELFKSSKVEQKRALLNLLLSNCVLKDGKALYSMKKPFDILMNMNGNPIWQPQPDSNWCSRLERAVS